MIEKSAEQANQATICTWKDKDVLDSEGSRHKMLTERPLDDAYF